jgi:hypothetical protein
MADRSLEGIRPHAGYEVEPEEQPELLDDEVDRASLLSMDASDPPSSWGGPDEPRPGGAADRDRLQPRTSADDDGHR